MNGDYTIPDTTMRRDGKRVYPRTVSTSIGLGEEERKEAIRGRLPAELDFMRPHIYSAPLEYITVHPLEWFVLLVRWPSVYMGEIVYTRKPSWLEKLLFRDPEEYVLRPSEDAMNNMREGMIVRQAVLIDGKWVKVVIQQ